MLPYFSAKWQYPQLGKFKMLQSKGYPYYGDAKYQTDR
jgi:hypothetical protein